jgi:hypothetical protein
MEQMVKKIFAHNCTTAQNLALETIRQFVAKLQSPRNQHIMFLSVELLA